MREKGRRRKQAALVISRHDQNGNPLVRQATERHHRGQHRGTGWPRRVIYIARVNDQIDVFIACDLKDAQTGIDEIVTAPRSGPSWPGRKLGADVRIGKMQDFQRCGHTDA